jgi:hypothetical protein
MYRLGNDFSNSPTIHHIIYDLCKAETEVLQLRLFYEKRLAEYETDDNGFFISETRVVVVRFGDATVRCFMPRRETQHALTMAKQAFGRS